MKIRIKDEEVEIEVNNEEDLKLAKMLIQSLHSRDREKPEVLSLLNTSNTYKKLKDAIKTMQLGRLYKVIDFYKASGYSGKTVGGWMYNILDLFVAMGYLEKVMRRGKLYYRIIKKPE